VLRRIMAITVTAAAVLALTAGTTLATASVGTVDQNQTIFTGGTGWRGGNALAQTFTAAVAGSLTEVDVYIGGVLPTVQSGAAPAEAPSFNVEITSTDSGDHFPASMLSQQGTTAVIDPGWVQVTFTDPYLVTAGTVYAIVILPLGETNLQWLGTCSATDYTRGDALIDANGWQTVAHYATTQPNPAPFCQQDFAFQELVVAAPAATAAPTTTAPPTSTVSAADNDRGQGPSPLLLGGLCAGVLAAAAAAAFVVRRHNEADRP